MATQVGFQLESSLASKHLTDAEYIKGGYIVVETLAQRDALPIASATSDGIIVDGSLVYVSEETKAYRYRNYSGWIVVDDYTPEEAERLDDLILSLNSRLDNLATVATSGDYDDLINKPVEARVENRKLIIS